MDMMREAKLKKLKDLKRMLQMKVLEAIEPEELGNIVSDNVETNDDEGGNDYEEVLSERQGLQGEQGEEGTLEEGLREMMMESMRGPKRSGSPLKTKVLPPEPSISISVSTISKPMKKKKKRKA